MTTIQASILDVSGYYSATSLSGSQDAGGDANTVLVSWHPESLQMTDAGFLWKDCESPTTCEGDLDEQVSRVLATASLRALRRSLDEDF